MYASCLWGVRAMTEIGNYVLPLAVGIILAMGIIKKVAVFDVFCGGAKDSLVTVYKILPSLIGLMTAVAMLKASGTLDIISHSLSPVSEFFGIPGEVVPLGLLRPVSGSGSLAILNGIFENHGADSFIGRVASVIQGSTETTFYTLTVYYGSIGIKNTRHTVGSALTADITGMVFGTLAVRMIMT